MQEWSTLKDFVIEFSCFEFVPTQERWSSSPTYCTWQDAASSKWLASLSMKDQWSGTETVVPHTNVL